MITDLIFSLIDKKSCTGRFYVSRNIIRGECRKSILTGNIRLEKRKFKFLKKSDAKKLVLLSIRSRENMLVLAQGNDILGIIQETRKIFLGPFLIFIFPERAV
jgi:hypothetical protein